MNDIHLFRPVVSEEAINAAAEVLRSGWTGLGPKTAQFEDDFAKYVGSEYCVALNSCTAALHLAMHILDLQPGDEVITTPLTFVSTNHAILYVGATPVFADVQVDTGCLDPQDVERKITPNTKAIVVVHYGGYPGDMEEFQKLSLKYNIPIIEDCAHAAGASYKQQKIGSISSLNCFSFHSVKNLSIADGGAITTSNPLYNERLRRVRWLGIDKSTFARTELVSQKQVPQAYAWQYNVDEVGYKYHMCDVFAAIGIEQLKVLDVANRRRAEIANIYREGLKDTAGINLLRQDNDRESAHHLCAVRAQRREKLIGKLKAYRIHPGVHYFRNDYYDMYDLTDLPNAETLHNELISLPLHLTLTDDDVERVIKTINSGW